MRTLVIRIFFIAVFFLAFSATGFSDVLCVPDEYPTIQNAIYAAEDGDIVLVKPGTYVENTDFLGKAITVRSDSDCDSETYDISPETTIIDGNQTGSVVTFGSGEGLNSIIEGFTVRNGLTQNGGGICCLSSSPSIKRNIIKGNSCECEFYGGAGIYCGSGASPEISNNTVRENSSQNGAGGGISCCHHSSPMIKDNLIESNFAYKYGGGIFCFNNCSPTVTNNTISRNSAGLSGGGLSFRTRNYPFVISNTIIANSSHIGAAIICNDHSPAIIKNNNIVENSATSWGGGVHFGDSDVRIENNTITENYGDRGAGISCNSYEPNSWGIILNNDIKGNIAPNWGGGIGCWENSSPTIINNNIFNNSASRGGGILCNNNSDPMITNNTIHLNSANIEGGGLYCTVASPIITNTILWDNSAPDGPEIYVELGTPTVTYCNVKGGWEGEGNIDSDPLFVTGSLGDCYLSQLGAGQDEDSPCADSGSDLASNIWVNSLNTMDILTTRTDHLPDGGIVDIGYHYISEIGLRYGNVNLENGCREKLFKINGSAGDDTWRIYTASTGDDLTMMMDAPPSGPLWASFTLYAFIGQAGFSNMSEQPFGIGTFCFCTPLNGCKPPQVFTIANNFGLYNILGHPYLMTNPAPTTVVTIPGGTLNPITLTLQGLIDDAGSAGPGVSLTNAIVLKVL